MNEYPFPFTGKNDTGEAFTTEANSSYSMPLGATGKYLGNQAKPIVFKVRVVTAFTGGTEGVRVTLCTSDTATIGADAKAVGVFVSPNMTDAGIIPVTDIDAIGDCLWCVIPPNIKCLAYLYVHVEPVSTALATGYFKVTAEDGVGEAGAGCVG